MNPNRKLMFLFLIVGVLTFISGTMGSNLSLYLFKNWWELPLIATAFIELVCLTAYYILYVAVPYLWNKLIEVDPLNIQGSDEE